MAMKKKVLLLALISSFLLSGCTLDLNQIIKRNSSNSSSSSNATSSEQSSNTSSSTTSTSSSSSKEANTYIVSFDPGRGTGAMDNMEVEESFSISLPKCKFTPPLGESFYRWMDDLTTYKEGATVTIYEDTVFTAIYLDNGKDIFTVSFDANGGTGTMNPVQVEEGLYTLPICGFTAPSNKTFDYWSISTGTTHYQPDQQINVTQNVVVTANWKNAVTTQYTLSYNSNGGSGSMASKTVNEGTWVYLDTCTFTPPISTKEFDYWRINSSAYDAGQAYQVNSNVTAYAVWKDKEDDPVEPEWEDDKVYLDCGYYNMGIPSNKDNPVEIRTTLSADSSSWFNTAFEGDVGNGYRYIYRNSCSDGPSGHKCGVETYSTSHDGGGLKISNTGAGFGTPLFEHEGAKLEIRIGISSVNNSSEKPTTNKDTFHIYYFDKNNSYLGKTVIAEGTISTSSKELKFYYTESNAINVAYFEFRCNALPYKGGQSYNVGIGYCNIKSWERV